MNIHFPYIFPTPHRERDARYPEICAKKVEPIRKIIIVGLVALALFCSVLVIKIPVVGSALDGADFCGSCHVMAPQVESYVTSSHQNAASCNDCHTPHSLIAGSYYKAYTGVKDFACVVAGKTDDIATGETARNIIQQNCIDCHADTLIATGETMTGERYCFECHTSVRHTN